MRRLDIFRNDGGVVCVLLQVRTVITATYTDWETNERLILPGWPAKMYTMNDDAWIASERFQALKPSKKDETDTTQNP